MFLTGTILTGQSDGTISVRRKKSLNPLPLSDSASQQSHVHPCFQIVSLEGTQGEQAEIDIL